MCSSTDAMSEVTEAYLFALRANGRMFVTPDMGFGAWVEMQIPPGTGFYRRGAVGVTSSLGL